MLKLNLFYNQNNITHDLLIYFLLLIYLFFLFCFRISFLWGCIFFPPWSLLFVYRFPRVGNGISCSFTVQIYCLWQVVEMFCNQKSFFYCFIIPLLTNFLLLLVFIILVTPAEVLKRDRRKQSNEAAFSRPFQNRVSGPAALQNTPAELLWKNFRVQQIFAIWFSC